MTPDEIMELRSRVQDRGSLYVRDHEGRAGLDPLKVEDLLDEVAAALVWFADLTAMHQQRP